MASMVSNTLQNAFHGVLFSSSSSSRQNNDQVEIVDEQDGGDEIVVTSSGPRHQPLYGLNYMFRHRELAISLKVLGGIFSIVQMLTIYLAAFSYHHTSICIRNCEISYQENVKVLKSTFFYDVVEEIPDNYLQNGTLEEVSLTRMQLEDANDGTLANFTNCSNECDVLIYPLQFPLLIGFLHACFTFGLLTKQNYGSEREMLAIFGYYIIEGFFLFGSIICLIYAHAIGKEHEELPTRQHYYRDYSMAENDLQIAAIFFTTFTLVIHVIQGLNHRRPSRASLIASSRRFNHHPYKAVYKLAQCQGPRFALIMKAANCALSLAMVIAVTFYTFHNYYNHTKPSRPNKSYVPDYHIEVKLILLVPLGWWHAIICFSVPPATNRYKHPCQVQLVLTFYIIEIAVLTVFLAADILGMIIIYGHTLGNRSGSTELYWAPFFIFASFALWIVDFALHQFPGHECCNTQHFTA